MIAILMQICNILVKDRRNFHFYQKSLFETYLNSMSADLAPTKKFWQLRTTRKGISLNHRSLYRPETALQMQEEMQQGISCVHSIYALPAGIWPELVLAATAFRNCCLQNFYV